MFVAMSRFRIANGMADAVRQAFRDRPRQVDGAPGFVRLDVLSPRDCPEEIRLLTFWADEASFRAWYRGHAYHQAHAGIPDGLKLVPGSVEVEYFEHVGS